MKYRLKDKMLQQKLDEATDGEFSRRLQTDRERMGRMILIGCMGMIEDRRRHNHTKHQRMTLCFAPDEIEEVGEYYPYTFPDEPFIASWMRFPEHIPQRGVYLISVPGVRMDFIPNPDLRETFAKPIVKIAYFIEGINKFMDIRSGDKYDKVTAWMPMPKPYNEKTGE